MSKELKPVKVVSSPEKFICAATVELDGPFKVLYGATGLIGQRHLQVRRPFLRTGQLHAPDNGIAHSRE